jgi:spermidine synthase
MRRYFGFFFLSGFCSLLYEIVWLRLAMASFGVTAALVSIVLSVFMAGLGTGSWLAGVLTRRAREGRSGLRFYGLAELFIGISALSVPYVLRMGRIVLQHSSGVSSWQSFEYYVIAGIWIAVALIPPCICMGATFPFLMSVIRATDHSKSDRSFSFLYAANVFGAFTGTVLSAFVLLELLGFQTTLFVAAVLNLVVAISALVYSRQLNFVPPSPQFFRQTSKSNGLYGLKPNAILWMLFTSGFVSMGLEVIWVRQFTPYLGNVVYAFAGILALYLFCTFMGSTDYRSWIRSHAASESGRAWPLLALFAIIPIAAADPRVPLHLPGVELGGLRLGCIAFFCGYTGFLMSLLMDAWSSGEPDRAGTAYAVNIFGTILGPLVAGFVLLPRIGERWATALFSLPLFLIAAFISARCGLRTKFALCSFASIAVVALTHDYKAVYRRTEERRDYAATVIAGGEGFSRRLLVNGIGMTSLTPITKYMAHLPLALLARRPERALVICFGMGTSFRSALSWGIPTTAIDLIPSVPQLFGYFHDDAAAILRSPHARIVIDDGRRFLEASREQYDVIIVDPPPPPQATGSSLLYSVEFYDIAKQHLSPGGILQVWYPGINDEPVIVSSVTKAIENSFPYVRAFPSFDNFGIHFLASTTPFKLGTAAELAQRMPHAAAADFVEWGPGTSSEQQFEQVLPREIPLDELTSKAPGAPALRDDRPVNEYYLLRRWFGFGT